MSRSTSSSSYSGDEAHTSSYRRSQLRGGSGANLRPGNVGGDYKIRRSSNHCLADIMCVSLQLSERSPSRQLLQQQQPGQPHKVVVRLGNVPKERPAYPGGARNPPKFRVSPNSTLDRLRRETASHAMHAGQVDVVDNKTSKSFDNNNYGVYEYADFDKSKSFDENYILDDREKQRAYVATEGRSYSHDRVFGSTGTSSSNEYSQSSSSRNRTSPQSYGARLYDHELQQYSELGRKAAMSRSPIIGGYSGRNRGGTARDRSPVPGSAKLTQQHGSFQKDLMYAGMRSLGTPDSEYDDRTTTTPDDPAAAAAFKEAELVKKFLYAAKNKQMQRESGGRGVVVPPAGTPTSGSCTASSCDFWPHCGAATTPQTLTVVGHGQLTKSGSENCLNRRSLVVGDIVPTGVSSAGGAGSGEVIVISGGSRGATMVPVKANSYGGTSGHAPLRKQQNVEIHDRDLPAVLGTPRYLYGMTSAKANSITFLGEHEMPITRDPTQQLTGGSNNRQDSTTSSRRSRDGNGGSSNSSVKSNSSNNYKVSRSPNNRRHGSNGSGGSGSAVASSGKGEVVAVAAASTASVEKTGSGSDGRDRKASSKPYSMRPRSASIKRKFEMKLKSRSLPKSFMRHSALTSDDLELSAIFASNSPLQLRAVSSPSLTEPTPPVAITTTANTVLQQQQQHAPAAMTKDGRLAVTQQHQQLGNKAVVLAKTGGHHNPSQQVSESVLQKFKKTFAQFKPTTKAAASPQPLSSVGPGSHSFDAGTNFLPQQQQQHPPHLVTTMSVDSAASDSTKQGQLTTHHRFGPLIWRSSKERRKTKSHRRDKCNSGDSGIQVELEPDELLHDGLDTAEPTVSTHAGSVSVRRANSAKVSSGVTGTTLLKHKLSLKSNNKENVAANVSRLSGKSLSQPSGLDSIAAGGELRRSATDLTDSDSDDHHEHHHPHHHHHPDHRLRPSDGNDDEEPVFAEVLFSFRPAGPQELALEKGALVEVLKRETGPWWWGRIKSDAILATDEDEIDTSDCGWFPMDFVKVVPTFNKPKQIIIINNGTRNGEDSSVKTDGDLKNCDSLDDPTGAGTMMTEDGEGEGPVDATATSQDRQTKENVIKELLETEINYVKLLNSLCLGYIKPLREREDVFPAESVNIVFSNLEKIWRFQQTFLDALRIAVPNNRIGEVFLEYQSAFMIYSSYCNSYPRALMELENYTHNKEACTILENCRVAQNLPELPLSAHLLAPIQRICRYPLHLSELVKHSPTRKELLPQLNLRKCTKSELETLDCRETFELALTAMRRVTEMVNEGKRHSEYLSRIQSRFENFQGPSINVHSTRLFLQTDAIRMSPNLWNNTYTLFLFDRQLIYCKKDLLKRTNYIYKGRIFLDNCRILNLPDGKMFGVTLKNALRLYCDTRNKWFDFCFRSSSSKLRFLNTLSAERQFCGESLFVSELDGACVDEDNLSDREYFPFGEDKDGCSNTDTETSNGADLTDSMQFLLGNMSQSARSSSNCSNSGVLKESPTNVKATTMAGNTLPKKSRKLTKEQQQQLLAQQQTVEYSSHSLGRRKLGNWFRKAKSTNSTPSQSPTHHPMALSLAAVNAASDSSSASSPGLGYQQRTLSALSANGTTAVPAVSKGKPKDPTSHGNATLMTQSSTS
ncbi:uncharacterized protein LOC6036591 [Culex quinquefasciatus]|uniref:uncharacterized protein LOC6036591 n=1 Tax=Culex quinquefasciatus TaxID=7176 RepID=UPI0018E3B6EA|nr:uncharacterized protein LOC6036591 [Culex quinquefasciatus]